VAVKRPVALLVGNELDLAHLADGDVVVTRASARPSAPAAIVPSLESNPVQMDRVVGHGEIAHADAHRSPSRTLRLSMPGKARLFQVHRLKSSMVLTCGVALPADV